MATQPWNSYLSQSFVLTVSIVCICYGKPHRKHQIDSARLRILTNSQSDDLFILNNLIKHRTKRDCDSQDDDWVPMRFIERISKHYENGPEYIIQGNVLRLRNGRDPSRPYSGEGHYIAEVQIECVFKGYAFEAMLNISGFGPTDDCVDSEVEVGQSYVILIQKLWFGYVVQEVNDQEGAKEATLLLRSKVRSLYKCRAPYETTTVKPSSSDSSSVSDEGYSQYSFVIRPSSDSRSYEYSLPNSYECGGKSSSVEFESYSYNDFDRDGKLDICQTKEPTTPRLKPGSREFRLILSVSGLGAFIVMFSILVITCWRKKRRTRTISVINLRGIRKEEALSRDLIC